ncbi:MAG: hypothetical protein RUMPE_00919 [Eubacteriales bacterium SKADARSKE-1]|nr:hypothetical protein [Eubacteriales bacterium SKADARSKE-1]
MANDIPTMLTIRETAEKTRLAEHLVRQLCLNGKIVAIRSGKKWLINFDKFVDYLNDPKINKNENSFEEIRKIKE